MIDMLDSCLRGNYEVERQRLAHRSADLLLQALGMPVPVCGMQCTRKRLPARALAVGRCGCYCCALAISFALRGNAGYGSRTFTIRVIAALLYR